MVNIYSKEGAMDVSQAAGTDMFLITAPAAGKIDVSKCIGVMTEATGTMTVDGVVSLTASGNEIGTFTPGDDAALGYSEAFTVDGTYATAANPTVEFAKGDDILVEIGTQATGTATGDGDVFLAIEFGL